MGDVAGVFLLLVAWGPTHAFRTLWGVALLAALIAGGVLALRHQTLAERTGHAAAGSPIVPGPKDAPA